MPHFFMVGEQAWQGKEYFPIQPDCTSQTGITVYDIVAIFLGDSSIWSLDYRNQGEKH